LLELIGVSVSFDGLRALDDVSFQVDEGEILGLIGPNGSGKSTAFNVVTGVVPARHGRVIFDHQDITGVAPHRIARLGIGRTFQLVRPFVHLTALDNVLAGAMFGPHGAKSRRAALDRAHHILEQVGLADKAQVRAASLTVRERKWLEVGRALAGSPKLLLLDEFMAGISPGDVPQAVQLVRDINDSGITFVIVEHIVKAITSACDRIVVLDAGRKLAEGSVSEVVDDPAVITAYLGTKRARG
jgi:branched-chain amino acid transport system ATP-binding protein